MPQESPAIYSVRFSDPLLTEIRERADVEHRPVAQLIRVAVMEYLERRLPPVKGVAPEVQ